MRDLTAQQSRQLINCEQLYMAYRDARRDLSMRFAGSMSWKTVGGHAYLYRKSGAVWKSLGPRDDRTRDIHAQFHGGRDALRDRCRTLDGLLRAQDASFRPTASGSFRAVNDDGFMVDLSAAEIDGLSWLENVPALDRIVIDERGYPLTMVVPDPRAFMCHKSWLARRDDRDPLKRRRDGHQARTLAGMLATRIPALRLDDPLRDRCRTRCWRWAGRRWTVLRCPVPWRNGTTGTGRAGTDKIGITMPPAPPPAATSPAAAAARPSPA
jgi:hypothetical protein